MGAQFPAKFVARGTWVVNFVAPANAGVQTVACFVLLDSGFHRNDERGFSPE